MLFPLADFRFTSPSEYLLNNPPNLTSGLRASNTSGMPEFPGPGNSGQGQLPPQPQTLPQPRPSSWLSRLSQLPFSELHHALHQDFAEFFSKMAREIRPELAIDRRNQLYFQSRYLLDAIEVRLEQFRREGTVPDDDLLCAQSDHDFLRQSVKAVWIMDYDRHQMATHGRLPILWEENPPHLDEAPQDAMEEESQARLFEGEARANLDDLLYSQMSAEEGEEPR
ncbi:hypothetical protein DL765_005491 [Monosporascus sp. GIB2]|nr:hypothetical protein DL765_005491 [Monosporascus sp. GIB2]